MYVVDLYLKEKMLLNVFRCDPRKKRILKAHQVKAVGYSTYCPYIADQKVTRQQSCTCSSKVNWFMVLLLKILCIPTRL